MLITNVMVLSDTSNRPQGDVANYKVRLTSNIRPKPTLYQLLRPKQPQKCLFMPELQPVHTPESHKKPTSNVLDVGGRGSEEERRDVNTMDSRAS